MPLLSALLFGQVKFWDFEVANGNLGMVHTRSLKVTDDVLCVRYSRHKQQSKLLLAGVSFRTNVPVVCLAAPPLSWLLLSTESIFCFL